MLFVAASTAQSAMDRLRQIPGEFWMKFGLGVLGIIVAVIVLRKLAHVNKVVLSVVVGLVLSIIGFSWIYERNEPSWATPAIEFLAEFFPSKGKITGGH